MPMKSKSRQSLLSQYQKAEEELDQLMDNIPEGGLSKKQDDKRRKLKSLLQRLGTQLGSMSPPDKEYP